MDKRLEEIQLEEIQREIIHREEMIVSWRKLIRLGRQLEEHLNGTEEEND